MFAPGGNTPRVAGSVPLLLDAAWSVDAMFGGALLRTAAEVAAGAVGSDGWIAVESSARFLRPMSPGEALAEVDVLHRGRATCVVTVRLVQGGRIGVVALLTLAREESVPPAGSGAPTDLPLPGVAPAGPRAGVARQVDWRVVGDWGPAAGPLRAWVAPRGATHPPAPGWCLVAADLLAPALPGTARDRPVRIATLSLEVSLLARPASVWLAQEVHAEVVGAAAHATMRLASPAGDVVARVVHRAVLSAAEPSEMPYSAAGFGWGVPA